MKNVQFVHRISITEDFLDTVDLFEEMIERDEFVATLLKKGNEKKGRFSAAVRMLIKQYVDERKEDFLQYKQAHKKKKDD